MEESRFSIIDVVNINQNNLSIIRQTSTKIDAVCPRCGDTRGKFSISLVKDACNCFHCRFGGGPIALQKELTGETDNKKAAATIYKALDSGEYVFTPKAVSQEPEITIEKESDENISIVMFAILRHCELRKEHKEDLIKRGFSEEDIERFRFRSVPLDTKGLCKKLLSAGYVLEGIPGFYVDKYGDWDMAISWDSEKQKKKTGYFCPVFNGEMNLILGFQIRYDYGDPKYLWFSSSGKQKGISSGAMATYLPGKSEEAVIITEGILKATLVYCLCNKQVTVIGVPGVSNYKTAAPYLANLLNSYVFEAYDMDKALNPVDKKTKEKTERIAQDAQNLKNFVEENYGLIVKPLKWQFDENGYSVGEKGLDDFLSTYPEREKFIQYILGIAHNNAAMMKNLIKKTINPLCE